MRWMRWVVWLLMVSTIVMFAYEGWERRHVAPEASGKWWCAGEVCNLEPCGLDVCQPQDHATCFAQSISGTRKTIDECRSTFASCEYARKLRLRDGLSVYECRVVSATAEDREAYKLHSAIAWVVGGMTVLTAWALRAWEWTRRGTSTLRGRWPNARSSRARGGSRRRRRARVRACEPPTSPQRVSPAAAPPRHSGPGITRTPR
jgi:hypothetical protein